MEIDIISDKKKGDYKNYAELTRIDEIIAIVLVNYDIEEFYIPLQSHNANFDNIYFVQCELEDAIKITQAFDNSQSVSLLITDVNIIYILDTKRNK